MFDGFQCQLILSVEMMEEAPLDEPSSFADNLDSHVGAVLTAENM
jgi:hypothetical protein